MPGLRPSVHLRPVGAHAGPHILLFCRRACTLLRSPRSPRSPRSIRLAEGARGRRKATGIIAVVLCNSSGPRAVVDRVLWHRRCCARRRTSASCASGCRRRRAASTAGSSSSPAAGGHRPRTARHLLRLGATVPHAEARARRWPTLATTGAPSAKATSRRSTWPTARRCAPSWTFKKVTGLDRVDALVQRRRDAPAAEGVGARLGDELWRPPARPLFARAAAAAAAAWRRPRAAAAAWW